MQSKREKQNNTLHEAAPVLIPYISNLKEAEKFKSLGSYTQENKVKDVQTIPHFSLEG